MGIFLKDAEGRDKALGQEMSLPDNNNSHIIQWVAGSTGLLTPLLVCLFLITYLLNKNLIGYY